MSPLENFLRVEAEAAYWKGVAEDRARKIAELEADIAARVAREVGWYMKNSNRVKP